MTDYFSFLHFHTNVYPFLMEPVLKLREGKKKILLIRPLYIRYYYFITPRPHVNTGFLFVPREAVKK